MKKPPAAITVTLNSAYPRWVCYVSAPEPQRFFRGFTSPEAMAEWLARNGYAHE